ncbi:hypothetical protein CEXT_407731 [Caerostris extrusa]|uniref:Uncharacterized protein n=1 Tax=Caerostris extrusa TaxID=172846 RepID=A0AAV4MV07_CAEEX|nr:hypothetical protein CEXT_407731 [Caerostris extrusa]
MENYVLGAGRLGSEEQKKKKKRKKRASKIDSILHEERLGYYGDMSGSSFVRIQLRSPVSRASRAPPSPQTVFVPRVPLGYHLQIFATRNFHLNLRDGEDFEGELCSEQSGVGLFGEEEEQNFEWK